LTEPLDPKATDDAAEPGPRPEPAPQERGPTRRRLLYGALLAVGGAAAAKWSGLFGDGEGLGKLGDEGGARASVFVAQASSYEEDLTARILEGLKELGFGRARVRGKRVLLKPNLVETNPDAPHINTHPAVIVAAAEAFRRLDAADVFVAEGQGHRRDPWLVLEESGLLDALDRAKLAYTDLNHDDLIRRPNRLGLTGLKHLVLPRTLEAADLRVSLAKLKTHHWVGCTLSMKNLFGVLPGIHYGWPKNVLHQRGIEQSIVDINATAGFDLAIVDGVVGMEGDGPILGTPRPAGVLVMGESFPAVDATCARIMGLRVRAVRYLMEASHRGLGPIRQAHVEQRGASLRSVAGDFALLDAPHLRRYVAHRG
jgi:uncharacterized protein (DUF362 family)